MNAFGDAKSCDERRIDHDIHFRSQSHYQHHSSTQDCSCSCLSFETAGTATKSMTCSSLSSSPTTTTPELVHESLSSTMHDDHDSVQTCTTKVDTEKSIIAEREQPYLSSSTTASVSTTTLSRTPQIVPKINPNCDACPYCEDVCCTNYKEECLKCSSKMAHLERLALHRRQQELLQKQEQQRQRNSFPFFPSIQFTSKRTKSHNRLDHCNIDQDHSHNHNNRDTNELFTMTKCQMRRYNNRQDGIYIQCNNKIYDVTSYIDHHPGGINSILRKSGGAVDCTRDLNFHSANAKKLWNKFHVGYLVECPGPTSCDVDLNFDGDGDKTGIDLMVDGDGDSPMGGESGECFNRRSTGRDRATEILDQSEQCVIS